MEQLEVLKLLVSKLEKAGTHYQQFDKANQLEATIKKNLEALGYGG